MTIKELQDQIQQLEDEKGWNSEPDTKLVFLMEEMGEVAKCVRIMRGKEPTESDSRDLNHEFADVIQHLVSLANAFDLDLEQGLKEKKGLK
jgi:NTP pyrophosphatase (non-canonical NTP hydrolase)